MISFNRMLNHDKKTLTKTCQKLRIPTFSIRLMPVCGADRRSRCGKAEVQGIKAEKDQRTEGMMRSRVVYNKVRVTQFCAGRKRKPR